MAFDVDAHGFASLRVVTDGLKGLTKRGFYNQVHDDKTYNKDEQDKIVIADERREEAGHSNTVDAIIASG